MNMNKTKLIAQLCIVTLLLLAFAAAGTAQTRQRWSWKEAAVKNKPQTQFSLSIQRRGNRIWGVYSVDRFINGEWQGEDGNQTPFVGTVKNGLMRIEFDPSATVPGYQQNVKYTKPRDGRTPTIATLKPEGKALIWTLIEGQEIEGLAKRIKLTR
jgi:hypothetical protein